MSTSKGTPKLSLKLMISDVMATIEDGIHEKVTLNDEKNVMDTLNKYLVENYSEVELEEISILLLSYLNPPCLCNQIPCSKWIIKCESHIPYVRNLLAAVPLNCDYLEIELESGNNFEDFKELIKSKNAKEVKLRIGNEIQVLEI